MPESKFENHQSHIGVRLIRVKEVVRITGLSRSYVYSLAIEGMFPKSIPLVPGGCARAWVLSEIEEWMQSRIAGRDAEVGR